MRSREYAAVLLRKAEQDIYVVDRIIDDPDSPDEIIGFHAQQAVEKLLKAVLSFHAIPYRRTHDLVELIDLLVEHDVSLPDSLEQARELTPFATEFRYDDLPGEQEPPFDRHAARAYVTRTRARAESLIGLPT